MKRKQFETKEQFYKRLESYYWIVISIPFLFCNYILERISDSIYLKFRRKKTVKEANKE